MFLPLQLKTSFVFNFFFFVPKMFWMNLERCISIVIQKISALIKYTDLILFIIPGSRVWSKTTIWIPSIAHIAIKWFIRITFELRIFKDLHITTKSPFHRRRYVTYSLWQKIKLSQHKVLLHVFYYWNQVSLTRFRILKTTSVCCKLHIFSDTR